jgi:hypothetical protein
MLKADYVVFFRYSMRIWKLCNCWLARSRRTLTRLQLQVNRGLRMKRACMARPEVNKTRVVWLTTTIMGTKQLWASPPTVIWCAMLRVNTSLVLNFPQFQPAGTDERLRVIRCVLSSILNTVGRGRPLASTNDKKSSGPVPAQVAFREVVVHPRMSSMLTLRVPSQLPADQTPAVVYVSCN